MIIKTDKLQDVCKKILSAVDTSTSSIISDVVELETKDDALFLNVTNKEYYVSVKLDLDCCENNFHSVVDASLFLNLISKITTKDVELKLGDNALIVKANGTYKMPIIYDCGNVVELPDITLDNITTNFKINTSVLASINKYNTKELLKSGLRQVAQKLFYIDEKGCITFTNGACVNDFTLEKPVKLLVNEKIVKLFKLFDSESVEFSLAYDQLNDEIIQSKIMLKNDTVCLKAITGTNNSLINSVPVNPIRNRAYEMYKYSCVIDKNLLLDSLTRLSLFYKQDIYTLYTYVSIDKDSITLYDTKKDNNEKINLVNSINNLEEEYTCIFNTNDLKLTLESCDEQYITFNFGNHQATVVERTNVRNVLPECTIRE